MAGLLDNITGYVGSPQGGNMLQALGMSLMSSPRNAPLAHFGEFYSGLQNQQMKQSALDQERADTMASRDAMAQALIASGVPPEEAKTLSVNPAAAKIRLDQIATDKQKAAEREWISGFGGLGGLGGIPATQPVADDGSSLPAVSAQSTPASAPVARQSLFGLPGAAQADYNHFRTDAAPPSDQYLEPVENIPQVPARAQASPMGPFPGMLRAGNINLANRPVVKNPDGSISTVRSMSFGDDNGREILVPTVSPDGKVLSDQDAIDLYGKTGQNLGVFDTPQHADQYAQALHKSQDQFYSGNKTMDYLQKNHPEVAALVNDETGITPRDGLEIANIRQKTMKKDQPAQDSGSDLDSMYAQRDRMASMLATAPDQKTFQQGKALLDALDTKIERAQGKMGRNKTFEYLSQTDPEIADMVQSGAISAKDGLSLSMQRQKGAGKPEIKIAGGRAFLIHPDNTVEDVTPQVSGSNGASQFRFGGSSVEAQALNGLMDSGQLTPEQAQQLGAGKTITGPNGEIIFMTPQGVFSRPPDQSGAVQPEGNIQITQPKASGDERKAMTFADRLSSSGDIIDQMQNAGTDAWETTKSKVPLVGNYLVGSDYQNLEQAERDFVNAQLRRESGAAISAEEFENARKQYFPQPGDSPAVLKQKAANRRVIIEGMARDAGPAYKGKKLPEGVSEDDIRYTMEKYGLSREEVLRRLGDQ